MIDGAALSRQNTEDERLPARKQTQGPDQSPGRRASVHSIPRSIQLLRRVTTTFVPHPALRFVLLSPGQQSRRGEVTRATVRGSARPSIRRRGAGSDADKTSQHYGARGTRVPPASGLNMHTRAASNCDDLCMGHGVSESVSVCPTAILPPR